MSKTTQEDEPEEMNELMQMKENTITTQNWGKLQNRCSHVQATCLQLLAPVCILHVQAETC